MKKVNYEQLKTAINAAVDNATIEFEYSKEVSDLLGYDPEQTGWFYRKNEEGVIECMIDNGQCNPVRETVEEFLKKFEPITFSNEPPTYEEFVDAIELALKLDVDSENFVEVTDLNELIKNYDTDGVVCKVFARMKDGEYEILINDANGDFDAASKFSHKEFVAQWALSVYYDVING